MTTRNNRKRSPDALLASPSSERGCISGVFEKVQEPAREQDASTHPLVARLEALELEKRAGLVGELCVDVIRELDDQDGPGGLLEHIAARAPWLWPRIDELRREHQLIRTLAVMLDRYVRRRAPQAMTQVTLARLTHALRRHHHAQTALMQEALLRDLGDAS